MHEPTHRGETSLAGHDVVWAAEAFAGRSDRDLLGLSHSEERILLTEDWDFGDIAVRLGERAFGIVIVAVSQFTRDPDDFADRLAGRLADLGSTLVGKLTIIEAGRIRQRDFT
jgi:predicted nuclease of predicted toxin-antitoxin system